jgi:hypothetical protein
MAMEASVRTSKRNRKLRVQFKLGIGDDQRARTAYDRSPLRHTGPSLVTTTVGILVMIVSHRRTFRL